jgi:hypothetical protein
MTQLVIPDYSKYETDLNEALRNVALEIRSVALLDLASFIHSDKIENIGDIVDSATELYFKTGTLQFSYSGEVKLDWFGIPLVTLDLEFHESGVDIYFKLSIETLRTNVKFVSATVEGRPLNVQEDLVIFAKALHEAKIYRSMTQGNRRYVFSKPRTLFD